MQRCYKQGEISGAFYCGMTGTRGQTCMMAVCQLQRKQAISMWQDNCAEMDVSSSVHPSSAFPPFGKPACNLSEVRTAFNRSLRKAQPICSHIPA